MLHKLSKYQPDQMTNVDRPNQVRDLFAVRLEILAYAMFVCTNNVGLCIYTDYIYSIYHDIT